MMTRAFRLFLAACSATLLLQACSGGGDSSYPVEAKYKRVEERGKLTGDGLTLFGGDSESESGGGGGIGVNGFLWRATLDTLSFMPMASADPFGGVVLTDWYEDPKTPGERFKVNALILDRAMRADAVKITLFKQMQSGGQWRDTDVNPRLAREIEDTILTRARELRVSQLGG